MPIHIRRNAEPFSARARPGHIATPPILARSQAGMLLEQELRRYCDGEVRGRSFLVAGHRGSGKTTSLDNALLHFQQAAWDGKVRFKPLPVYLLGPTLLDEVPDEDDALMGRVLVQVVLGLHHAVGKEYAARFLEQGVDRGAPQDQAQELSELAAQFQIELTEAPPPSRLREFWDRAGLLQNGLLFRAAPSAQQGLLELVALTGITHAHQRVSGDLQAKDDQLVGRSQTTESAAGLDLKSAELAKAVTAVGSGAAVMTAGIVSGNAPAGMLLGVLAALASSAFLRMSSSSSHKREHKLDRTFIPDLSIKTLHRLIPSLIDRLLGAGLAPVFVIDELDKVDQLGHRIYPLIRNLKKLFAESSFTCLLVDRGFYEKLLIREELEQDRGDAATPSNQAGDDVRQGALGRNFSYFSHRVFIAFRPVDLHTYLEELLEWVPGTPAGDAELVDLELIRWVLLHRSQLNALSLNRLLEELRGADDLLQLPGTGNLRRGAYRIDLSLQLAVELQLADPDLVAWLDKRPRLRQPALDAAYYVSRRWDDQDRARRNTPDGAARADGGLDLGDTGLPRFRDYLVHRMNLHEDTRRPEDAQLALQQDEERARIEALALSAQELARLYALAGRVAHTLAFASSATALQADWDRCVQANPPGSLAAPSAALFETFLLGPRSVLVRAEDDMLAMQFRWRYLPSGSDSKTTTLQSLADSAADALQAITTFEQSLLAALGLQDGAPAVEDHPMQLLGGRYRVLPATPAWSQVVAARAQILKARDGIGDVYALELGALPTLHEFAAMLVDADALEASKCALLCAAALAGLRSDAGTDRSLPLCLQILSEGLDFSACLLPEVRRRLERFRQELEEFLDRRLVAPGDGKSVSLAAGVDEAFAAARSVAPSLPSLADAAWLRAGTRLQAVAGGGPAGPASLDEIICAVRGDGPAGTLDLRLDSMTPRRWTLLLLQAVSAGTVRKEVSASAPAVPLWMAAYALERLGMRTLAPDIQQLWFDGLEHRGRDVEALRRHVAQHQLWTGPSAVPRLALVVCTGQESCTDTWPLPPQTGLLLAAGPADAARLVDALPDGLSSRLGHPLRVAWEPLAASTSEESSLRSQLRTRLGAKATTEVWLYRGQSIGQRLPRLVDVKSADELWATPTMT